MAEPNPGNDHNKSLSRQQIKKFADAFLNLGVVQAPPPAVRVCCTCNGYYGPAFWQPVCATCHAFLYSNDLDNENNLQMMSQANDDEEDGAEGGDDPDRDSGNEEPTDQEQNQEQEEEDMEQNDPAVDANQDQDLLGASAAVAGPVAINLASINANEEVSHDFSVNGEVPAAMDIDQEESVNAGLNNNAANEGMEAINHLQIEMNELLLQFFHELNQGLEQDTQPQVLEDARGSFVQAESLSQRLALLSIPRPADNISEGIVEKLPPEVLLIIFSFLDDVSLYAVGHVCTRWRDVLRTQYGQHKWQLFTRRRWPLFKPLTQVLDWFSTYSALVESSFCLTCIYQMAEIVPAEHPLPLREKRLNHDLRLLAEDPPIGITGQPLDSSNYHWQASIAGPVGSPYEGGLFFLYVKVPLTYPFDPPQVRFLTKIFHPNISRHGDIGIDCILPNHWVSGLTIPKVLISIQSLLTDAYCDVCMEPEIGKLYRTNRRLFDSIARNWSWRFAMHDAIPPKTRH